VANETDHARSIAERVAQRVKGSRAGAATERSPQLPPKNGAPVGEELSAIRTGLHDLERELARIESRIVQGSAGHATDQPRARLIDFVSSSPPVAASPSITVAPSAPAKQPSEFVPATHSPWLRDFGPVVDHPSQERFGVEEATVAELVEFFENEKKCSVEPGGKPCDHCAMCSSRGF